MTLRRGFAVFFTLVGVGTVLSMVLLFAAYLASSRGPAIPGESVLVLRPGGELLEVLPDDVVGQVLRRRCGHGTRADREPPEGEARPAYHVGAAVAGDTRTAVLGQGAGTARCRRRLPPIRKNRRRVPRIRRRPRVLPCERGGPRLPAAVEPARPHGHRVVRNFPSRRARQARGVSRFRARRRVQDGGEPVHREGLHARAPRDDRVAQSRPVRAARARHRRSAEEDRGRSAARCSTKARSRRRPRGRRDSSTTSPISISSTIGWRHSSADDESRERVEERGLPPASPHARSASGRARASPCCTPSGVIASGSSTLRHRQRRRRRLRHDGRADPHASGTTIRSRRSCCGSTVPAGRQWPPT